MSGRRWAALVALGLATLSGRVASASPCDTDEPCGISRFGDGMRGLMYRPPIIRFELFARGGQLALSNDDLLEDVPGRFVADGTARVRGGGFRMLLGYGTFYGGVEFSGYAWNGGPPVQLLVPPEALSPSRGSGGSAGVGMEGLLVVGLQRSLGPVILGGELGVGGQVGWTSDEVTIDAIPSASFGGATIVARARAGVWLTRHVSVVATVGTDLLESRDRQFGLALGFSLGPWDGQK